jgi:hypothetical protein
MHFSLRHISLRPPLKIYLFLQKLLILIFTRTYTLHAIQGTVSLCF